MTRSQVPDYQYACRPEAGIETRCTQYVLNLGLGGPSCGKRVLSTSPIIKTKRKHESHRKLYALKNWGIVRLLLELGPLGLDLSGLGLFSHVANLRAILFLVDVTP